MTDEIDYTVHLRVELTGPDRSWDRVAVALAAKVIGLPALRVARADVEIIAVEIDSADD